MAGNKEGGKKAAQKNLENNPNFYRDIAYKAQEAWERNGKVPRGFAYDVDQARISGAKGGAKSRKGHKFLHEKGNYWYYTELSTGKTVRFDKKN